MRTDEVVHDIGRERERISVVVDDVRLELTLRPVEPVQVVCGRIVEKRGLLAVGDCFVDRVQVVSVVDSTGGDCIDTRAELFVEVFGVLAHPRLVLGTLTEPSAEEIERIVEVIVLRLGQELFLLTDVERVSDRLGLLLELLEGG